LLQAQQGRLLRDGLKIVIAGQPNAGKSSLLNALAGADIAIVTNVPGTTRDVLTQSIHIEGVPLHLLDTAGLRDEVKVDEVEQLGMQRAWAHISDADIVLLLNDLSRTQDQEYISKQSELDIKISQHISSHTLVLRVNNKSDVLRQEEQLKSEDINISAKTGQGIDHLRSQILKKMGGNSAMMEGVFTARSRHTQALQNVNQHLSQAQSDLQTHAPPLDLIAEECRLAQGELSMITGALSADDLLGEIFSRFCIGK